MTKLKENLIVGSYYIVNIAKGTMDQKVELALKAEKDNAMVSMENVERGTTARLFGPTVEILFKLN